jgi:hypothetical protein
MVVTHNQEPITLLIEMRECEHTAHGALKETLQGSSEERPQASRLQALGRRRRTRQPEE